MIPVPVLRIFRGSERESGEVKAHPGAAVLHVLLECLTLSSRVRSRVEKHDHLVRGERLPIQVVPVLRGLEREVVLGGHPGKPRPRFRHEANVRGIRLSGVESNHLESWRRLLRECGRHAQTGRENGDVTRLSCHPFAPRMVPTKMRGTPDLTTAQAN